MVPNQIGLENTARSFVRLTLLAHTSRGTLAGLVFPSLAIVPALTARGQAQNDPAWAEPFPPFHIAGNLHHVGSVGLANLLITTPQGHILISSDLETNVPLICASVAQLGFKFSDIRILLVNHAHWDHNAGDAVIRKLTGATYRRQDCGTLSGGAKRMTAAFGFLPRPTRDSGILSAPRPR
jgi:metallo-beta-lactamase class B